MCGAMMVVKSTNYSDIISETIKLKHVDLEDLKTKEQKLCFYGNLQNLMYLHMHLCIVDNCLGKDEVQKWKNSRIYVFIPICNIHLDDNSLISYDTLEHVSMDWKHIRKHNIHLTQTAYEHLSLNIGNTICIYMCIIITKVKCDDFSGSTRRECCWYGNTVLWYDLATTDVIFELVFIFSWTAWINQVKYFVDTSWFQNEQENYVFGLGN